MKNVLTYLMRYDKLVLSSRGHKQYILERVLKGGENNEKDIRTDVSDGVNI